MKLDRFVDLNIRGTRAEYIRIYESIIIEFFLRLKLRRICTCVPRFYLEKHNFIVSMLNHETLAMQFHC